MITAWKKIVSSATTEEQLNAILALIERQWDERRVADEDTRNHCHVTVRHLRHMVKMRRDHLQNNYLQEQERLLAGYIRRQRKDFGWYLDASQKLITLFRQLNDGKGGAE